MEADEALKLLGGVASRRQLCRHVTPHALAVAIEAKRVVKVAHGRLALPGAAAAAVAASRLGGTVACLSAAEAAGWEIAKPPDRPWIAVPQHRSRVDGRGVHLIYSDARETAPLQIVLQCARRLPWPEALAVADSALRSGQVEQDELVLAAAGLRGPGSQAVRRVAAAASPKKTNVLESLLHAITLDVVGLEVDPQHPIDLGAFVAHADLADPVRQIAIEAEGWLFHGSTPESFDRDVERYTLMVVHRWIVVRFTRAQVMYQASWVREMLEILISTGTRP